MTQPLSSHLRTLSLTAILAAVPALSLHAADEAVKPPMPHEEKGEHGDKDPYRPMLEKFDANKDGKLDDAEKTAARADLAARLKEKHPEILKKIDTDGDGVISAEEFQKGAMALKELHEKRKDHDKEKADKKDK